MNKKLLYFDTETTDTQIKDLVQFAFITESNVSMNLFFKPKTEISCMAMSIHHITPEMVADKETFENTKLPAENIDPDFKGTTLIEYLKFLAEEYVWIAHNVDFDLEVLSKKGITIKDSICTLKLARNLFSQGDRDLEGYSLQFLRYFLGLYKNENLENNNPHDAFSDVHFLRDLFHYIEKTSSLSIENMIMLSKEPQFIRQINFGKYAGRTLEDIAKIDRGYLEWIVDTMGDKPDLQANAKRVLNIY